MIDTLFCTALLISLVEFYSLFLLLAVLYLVVYSQTAKYRNPKLFVLYNFLIKNHDLTDTSVFETTITQQCKA